jgi:hypothetical protein
MKEEVKKKRGGKRAGAGRPRKGHVRLSIGLRLPLDIYNYLQQQDNKSQFVEKIIREWATTKNIIL